MPTAAPGLLLEARNQVFAALEIVHPASMEGGGGQATLLEVAAAASMHRSAYWPRRSLRTPLRSTRNIPAPTRHDVSGTLPAAQHRCRGRRSISGQLQGCADPVSIKARHLCHATAYTGAEV